MIQFRSVNLPKKKPSSFALFRYFFALGNVEPHKKKRRNISSKKTKAAPDAKNPVAFR